MIYLDHHTAAKPLPEAVEKLSEFWGSLDAPHQKGQELYPHVDEFCLAIAQLLGVPSEFFLWQASSGMDAARQIFFQHYQAHIRETGRNHFLTTGIEPAAILLPLNAMEALGCSVKTVPVTSFGTIDLQALQEAIRPRTSLLSISWADPLTGVVQPIYEIAKLCRDRGISLHIDASMAIGKIGFRIEEIPCDYLSLDGAKFQAPAGAAAVFSRFKGETQPLNVPMLAAFAEALRIAEKRLDGVATETARLRGRLEQAGTALFQDVERLPNVAAIAFPGVHSEALLFLLHRAGVYASIGGGQTQKLSNVLQACGVAEELTESAISFSLSHETTEDEIDRAITIIGAAVRQLRGEV